MKNTTIVILVILSLVLGYFSYNGIRISSDRESFLEGRIALSNKTIEDMYHELKSDSILINSLSDSIFVYKTKSDSIEFLYNKSDSIYENKIDSIISLSTDSIANYIRSEITRRFFENKNKNTIK